MKLTPRIFLLLALGFGTVFALLTPPFQSPDEYNHFFRAWQVSEGHFFPEKLEGQRLGGVLPASLDTLKNRFVYLKNNYSAHTDGPKIRQALALNLEPGQRTFLDFPNTAIYAPTAYVPQAVGILLSRMLTDRVLIHFYAARLANLYVWIALVFFALRFMPFQKNGLAYLALLPSSLFLSSTVNADIITNGLSFWAIALACQAAAVALHDLSMQPGRNLNIAAVWAGALIAIHKLILAPFGALAALPDLKMGGGWGQALRRSALPLTLMFGLAIVWGSMANKWFVPYDQYDPSLRDAQTLNPGVDPSAQTDFILHHPLTFSAVVGKSLIRAAPSLAAHVVGKFGWEKNYLPGWMLALLWLSLLLAACSEKIQLSPRQRAWLMSIGIFCVVIWAVTMYALWCPVGSAQLDNWQGRYFVPVLPLFFLACSNGRLERRRRRIEILTLLAVCLGNIMLLLRLLERYY